MFNRRIVSIVVNLFCVQLDAIVGIEYPQGREQMLDALQLRFSLVGGMFDAIQKNTTATTDWAILLAQLISQGVIDLSTNRFVFENDDFQSILFLQNYSLSSMQ